MIPFAKPNGPVVRVRLRAMKKVGTTRFATLSALIVATKLIISSESEPSWRSEDKRKRHSPWL